MNRLINQLKEAFEPPVDELVEVSINTGLPSQARLLEELTPQKENQMASNTAGLVESSAIEELVGTQETDTTEASAPTTHTVTPPEPAQEEKIVKASAEDLHFIKFKQRHSERMTVQLKTLLEQIQQMQQQAAELQEDIERSAVAMQEYVSFLFMVYDVDPTKYHMHVDTGLFLLVPKEKETEGQSS